METSAQQYNVAYYTLAQILTTSIPNSIFKRSFKNMSFFFLKEAPDGHCKFDVTDIGVHNETLKLNQKLWASIRSYMVNFEMISFISQNTSS